MAGRPLRPATRRSLGRPTPHQQADRTRPHPMAQKLSQQTMRKVGPSGITTRFQELFQTMRQVSHALLTRSPLSPPQQAGEDPVRLACVKHAASVRPEPESNPPQKTHGKPNGPTKTRKNGATTNPTKRKPGRTHGSTQTGISKNNNQKQPNTPKQECPVDQA